MSEEEGGGTQSLKYIKFYGDLSDRGEDTKAVLPREFFIKAETFADTKGFCTAMTTEVDIDDIKDPDKNTKQRRRNQTPRTFLLCLVVERHFRSLQGSRQPIGCIQL
jgi:hypothetical protein